MTTEKAEAQHSHAQQNSTEQVDIQQKNTDNLTKHRPENIQELYEMLDKLEASNQEMSEKLDKLMRAYAEADNRAKRADKDRLDAVKFGPIKMARDLLDVADNFERALKNFPETNDDKIKEFHEGIILTEKSLLQVLKRFDIDVIDATGIKFDPNFHEAVTQIPFPDKQSGDIIDVIRKGYKMGDRLLRAAQVVTVA